MQTVRGLGTGLFRRTPVCQGSSGALHTFSRRCQPQVVRYASRLAQETRPPTRDRLKEHLRLAKKDYPILFPFLLVASVASLSVLGLVIWDRRGAYAELAIYPAKVEQHLRLALIAIHVKPDPEKSEYQFNLALQAAQDADMDPYSAEVIGIRLRKAEMLEKFGRAGRAVEVLENVIEECQKKLDNIGIKTDAIMQAQNDVRELMLKSIIRSRVKISALCGSDYLREPEKAKTILSDAVGLLVKETQDPQTQGFSENNAAGLSLEEIASMLSQMGDLYATTGEEANAVQVYMLTLSPLRQACNGTRSCREVQVLSNIASAMTLAMKKPGATINGQPVTEKSLAAARRSTLKWADQAIATAERVPAEGKDSLCELGLISAELTKADLLLEDGKLIQAKHAYETLLPKLQEKGLTDLISTANAGIQRAKG